MPRVPPVMKATRPASLSVAGGFDWRGADSIKSVMMTTSFLVGVLDEVGKSDFCGVGAAHAVGARSRRGGRRADVHSGDADLVGRQCDSGPECQLANVLGAGHD